MSGILDRIFIPFKFCRLIRMARVGRNCRITRDFGFTNTGGQEHVQIGDNCLLGCSLLALFGGRIIIGNNTYIGNKTIIGAKDFIKIGDNVIISDDVIIFDNNNHPVNSDLRLRMSQKGNYYSDEWSWRYAESSQIVIEDNVWIGKRAAILKGVKVGRGAIVALGAIVTKDVPPYSIVAGNPACVVKYIHPISKNKE